MLATSARLNLVPEQQDGPSFRLVHGRSVRLKGVLEIIVPQVGNEVYQKIGRLAVPKKLGVRHEFTLLTRRLIFNGHQLLVADDTALGYLREGMPYHEVPAENLGIANSEMNRMLALDDETNFCYHSYDFETGAETELPLEFSVDGKGEVSVTDRSKRGTYVDADWEHISTIPSQRMVISSPNNL